MFFKPKILIAAKMGMDIKKEIFAESILLKFKSLAAVIAIPDLLTPGTNDKTCKIPMKIAFCNVKFFSLFLSILNSSLIKTNMPNFFHHT